jgi:hypothetical protein
MSTNIGTLDRVVRLIVAAALLYLAVLAPPNGYNWIGWIGVIPLVTAIVGNCPLYTILGSAPAGPSRLEPYLTDG